MTKGIPLRLMRQLYQAIAIPKMLYAADLWFTPAFRDGSDVPERGSLGVAKRMTTVQRMAALAMTGAMRSTATDILEVHANLPPITLLLQNMCHRAIVRIASHPNTHPLYGPVRRAAKRYVSSHRSSLHKLTHRFAIDQLILNLSFPPDAPPRQSIHSTPTSQHPGKLP